MAEALFANFLNDPAEYDQAADCWRRNWRAVIARTPEGKSWSAPWIDNSFADGTPCRDGNPIFSAVCRSRRRAMRVIQLAPSLEQNEFSFWTNTFAKGDAEELEELVIACVLNHQTLLDAVHLFDQWIERGAVCTSKA